MITIKISTTVVYLVEIHERKKTWADITQEVNVRMSRKQLPHYFSSTVVIRIYVPRIFCGLQQTAGTTGITALNLRVESAQSEHKANPNDESNTTAAWHSTSSSGDGDGTYLLSVLFGLYTSKFQGLRFFKWATTGGTTLQ